MNLNRIIAIVPIANTSKDSNFQKIQRMTKFPMLLP